MVELDDTIENAVYDIMCGNISLKEGIRKIRRWLKKLLIGR